MKPFRVLLVEDDDELRGNLAHLLEQQGMVVDQAATGDNALTLLASDHYDVVVADVVLPAPFGTQLAAMARTAGASVPILVITARRDDPAIPETVSRIDRAELLLKPFSADEFLDHLRALMDAGDRE